MAVGLECILIAYDPAECPQWVESCHSLWPQIETFFGSRLAM
jgi:hypothetical protein